MTPGEADAWTQPTTALWQRLEPAAAWQDRMAPPWRHRLPVPLPNQRVLELPVRRLAGSSDRAVASLIANQASFEVVAALSESMAVKARAFDCEVIVGLPTLGMVFAPKVAQALGHARWVPLGHSRKFWYDEALSTELSSLTTPGAGKRLYLDPNQLPLLEGRRVLLVDDAVSSGSTLNAAWNLLQRLGVPVAGAVVAMRQGDAWRQRLGAERAGQVQGVFESPLLVLRDDGWWPL